MPEFPITYQAGKIIKVKVTKIWNKLIYLETIDKRRCFLNMNEVSDFYIKNPANSFKVGSIKQVVVLEVLPTKELLVSFKRIHPKHLKNPFKFRLDKENTNFEALLEFTNKGLRYGK